MNKENPYSSPVTETADSLPSSAAVKNELSLGAIAKRTFLAWEKLRLVYIAILVVVTIICFLILKNDIQIGEFIATIIFGAIFANLCYFAAPVIDTYISWLGFPSRALRMALFLVGTMFAVGLAVFSIMVLAGIKI